MGEIISVLCPTHKRPERQKSFAQSVIQNCKNLDLVEIVFGIDNNDDMALKATQELQAEYGDSLIRYTLIEPGERMSNLMNFCYKAAKGEIFCNVADDIIFRSKNWDQFVREAFSTVEDRIMLLWSDDGIWGGQLASHTFVHKNWVDAVGYINPPYFYSGWADKWNQEIAERLGRGSLVLDRDVLFLEHMHVSVQKMERDETAQKTIDLSEKHDGHALYTSQEMITKRHEDYEKLKNFIDQYKNMRDK